MFYSFKPSRLKTPLSLSENDMLLIHMICDLGFVTTNQLNMLYSVVQHYPSTLSRTILSKWTAYNSLIQKLDKSSSSNTVKRVVYIPTKRCRQFLQDNGFPVSFNNLVSVNYHNIEAIEVVVQAIYSTMFKAPTFGTSVPAFVENSAYKLLMNPEISMGLIDTEYNNQIESQKGRNQIIYELEGITRTSQLEGSASQSNNQNGNLEGSTKINEVATLTHIEKQWLKRHQSYIDTYGNSSIDGLIPIVTKQIDDSLLDGVITNGVLRYLYKSLPSIRENSNKSNDSKDISSLLSMSTPYIDKPFTNSEISRKKEMNKSKSIKENTTDTNRASERLVRDSLGLEDSGLNNSGKSLDSPSGSKGIQCSNHYRFKDLGAWLSEFDSVNGSDSQDTIHQRDAREDLDSLLGMQDHEIALSHDESESSESTRYTPETHNEEQNGDWDGELRHTKYAPNTQNSLSDSDFSSNNVNISGDAEKAHTLDESVIWRHTQDTPESQNNSNIAESTPHKANNFNDLKKVHIGNESRIQIDNVLVHTKDAPNEQVEENWGHTRHVFSPNNVNNEHQKGKINNNEPFSVATEVSISKDVLHKDTKKGHPKDTLKTHSNADSFSNDKLHTKDVLGRLDEEKTALDELLDEHSNKKDNQPDSSSSSTRKTENIHREPEKEAELFDINSDKAAPYSYFFPNQKFLHIFHPDFLAKYPDKVEAIATENLRVNADNQKSKSSRYKYRYPQATPGNINRNINLISNQTFDLANLDISSFKNQYKYQQFTFVADEVMSFERHGFRHEVFIELDNRTESNATQIQKILNYISYALDHPNRKVLLIISITDGSLPTAKVDHFTNISRKLASLADRFLKSFIPNNDGEKIYFTDLYNQATNLKIVLSGVSESHIDVSQFLLGSNFSLDYYNTINEYVDKLNEESDWKVSFKPSREFKQILANPTLATSSLDDLPVPKIKSKGKDIWGYVETNSAIPLLGELDLHNRLSRAKITQPVIAGDEHSLDTVIQTYQYSSQAHQDKSIYPPVVIYPTRERTVSSISLPQFKKWFNWTDNWRANIPVYVQPKSVIENNLQLHRELRWLTMQYDTSIYNYFKIGAVSKAALKQSHDYGQDYIRPLRYTFGDQARTYEELHLLAERLDKNEFIDQLQLNEVPLGLFRDVLKRWPTGQYSLPLIMDLGYFDSVQLKDQRPKDKFDISDYIIAPNSIILESRKVLNIKRSY